MYAKHRIALAPMAGVSDRSFRQLCLEQGAQLTFTEMVSAKGLSYANKKTANLISLAPNEQQVVVQLFGHEPAVMAKEAQEIEQKLGNRLFSLDINMGCPAKKIVKKGDGSALMKNPYLAGEIVKRVSSAIKAPVSVKFRRGFSLGEEAAVTFAQEMEKAGAKALCIHPRYAMQFYRGQADWIVIQAVKEAVSVPVVGNGDIACGLDARAMVEQTGCDAVMVGRAAMGNPWIFADIASVFATGTSRPSPTVEERMITAKRHAALFEQQSSASMAAFRRHAMSYVTGMNHAANVRRRISSAATLSDFNALFDYALACNKDVS